MRHDSIEISSARAKNRTRRVWYGHGRCRIIQDNDTPRNLPSAEVIDEAIAGFERTDTAADRHPPMTSLVADLSAQLTALDHQRDRLARLLRDINNAPVAK